MRSTLIIGILLATKVAFSQSPMKEVHKIKNYQKIFEKANAQVKMEVYDKQGVESSRTYELRNLEIPENKNVNITYDNKISNVTKAKVPEDLTSKYPSGSFKIIPEVLFSRVKGSGEVVSYQIFFTSSRPFKYDHEKSRFNGGLGFVLINALENEAIGELEEPVYVEVVSPEIEEISPKKLSIDHLNLPSAEIEMIEKGGVDSLKIRIITKSNLSGYETYIPIEPTLNISAQESKIMGFGLEKTRLNVSVKGTSSEEPIEVSFLTGSVTPSKINLSANQTQTVDLRSGNMLGTVKIEAFGKGVDSQDYTSNSIEIKYIFPWMFMLFSILGGILGHIAKYRKATKLKTIHLGMIDGLIAAVFYFVLKIPIPILGELDFLGAVIFGVGILGGYVGITRLFPKLRATLDSEEDTVNR